MWQSESYAAARFYLDRLGNAEYRASLRAHLKAGRSQHTHRYNPSDYHRQLVKLLGQNDEEAFKALKLEQGYASTLGF